MKIIGLDISLTGTGVAVYSSSTRSIYTVCIRTKPQKDWYGRIKTILSAVLKEVQGSGEEYEPILVCVEGFAFGARGKVFEIAELSGVIKYHLTQVYDCNLVQIPPTSVKKYITGKGNANKDVMLKEVYKVYNFDSDNDNEVDAFALLVMGLDMIGESLIPLNANTKATLSALYKNPKFDTEALHDFIRKTKND
jgi:crossover junction endodeoxyribonuclease RuvC